MTKIKDKNICINCNERLEELRSKLSLSTIEFELLNRPRRSFSFAIPVRMDNGEIRTFNAYRVQYNDAIGPTKGGFRYHNEVDLEDVKTLAFLMSLKTALVGIPFGGAKGGIEVDPKKLSDGELERLTRGFVRSARNFIGPMTDIPAPDVGTNPKIMAWFVDEYAKITGKWQPGVVTGKPVEVGGSLGRDTATALGAAFVLREYIKKVGNDDPSKISVAIQGIGNAGENIAKILDDWGYNIVAISNSQCGIYNINGLDIKEVIKTKHNNSFCDAKNITNEELLELDVDVLIPAAINDVITVENVKNIKASIILEVANAPITKSADDVLSGNNIDVLPDILVNAGGVVVSYFEWMQNSSNEYLTEEKINSKLEDVMVSAFNNVFDNNIGDTSLRDVAYKIAIDKILYAERLRGNL